MKKVSARLIYPILIWLFSSLIAVFYVIKNDGFGKGDIQGFSMLTLIFSAISFFLYSLFEKIFNRVHLLIAVLLLTVFTLIQSVIFMYTAWFIFGPWLGAFSFPIFRIWLTATGIGNFYILLCSENAFGYKHLLKMLSAGLIIYILTLLYSLTQNLSTKNQDFDIICLSWTPSQKVPEIHDLMRWSLTQQESKDIIDSGIKGHFWGQRFFSIRNSKIISPIHPDVSFEDTENSIFFTFGNDIDTTKTSERPKVIIIMNHPQETHFIFKQPVNKTMIVIQNEKEDGFKIFPEKIDLNAEKIKIGKTDFYSFPYWTYLSIGLKWNDDFSVNGFQWMEK